MNSTLLCSEETDIFDEITKARSEMVELGEVFGLLHPDVQKLSEYLDQLINAYYMRYTWGKLNSH